MPRRRLLWTPWRSRYVGGPKPAGCIFCVLPDERRDRENLILFRTPHHFGILNRFPYTSGHLMVVPHAHVSAIGNLSPEAQAEHLALVQHCIDALTRAMRPDGFNVGLNLGRAAGAGVDAHLHTHVVPRWTGDSNFVPVLDDTRLIPQALDDTWQKLIDVGIGEVDAPAPRGDAGDGASGGA